MGSRCPLLNKDCIEHRCAWWIGLRGTDKNTGKEIDEPGCAVAFLPMLLIENANIGRQTGAAIESLRNENIKGQDATRTALVAGLASGQMRLIDGDPGS